MFSDHVQAGCVKNKGVGNIGRFLFCACAVMMLMACSGSKSRPAELIIGHSQNQDHPVHAAMLHMGEILEDISGNEMSLKVYANGQLGSERELIELLQIGSVSMTKVSSLSLEGFASEMRVFSQPYIFENSDHYWRVLNGDVGQEVLDSLLPVKLKGLGYFDAGSRSFYMTTGPVRSPADLVGKKVRVLSSQASIEMVELLGGAAAPISFGELYTALQQGVVDGAENNPPSYFLARHYEAAKYYSLDEHISAPDVIIISERVWDSLTDQERIWLREAMTQATAYQRQLWTEAERDALEKLAAAGVEIIRPNKQPFRDAVSKMSDKYDGTEIGKIIIEIDALRDPGVQP